MRFDHSRSLRLIDHASLKHLIHLHTSFTQTHCLLYQLTHSHSSLSLTPYSLTLAHCILSLTLTHCSLSHLTHFQVSPIAHSHTSLSLTHCSLSHLTHSHTSLTLTHCARSHLTYSRSLPTLTSRSFHGQHLISHKHFFLRPEGHQTASNLTIFTFKLLGPVIIRAQLYVSVLSIV